MSDITHNPYTEKLVEKIKEGIAQSDAQNIFSSDKAKERLQKWFKD
ncbi:hypothetical protein [Flavobacterium psychrotrophum]|nr:hypothetical protein [Flavobacterium psychrotrophum]